MTERQGSTLQDFNEDCVNKRSSDLNKIASFAVLPIELISHIFGFLPYGDLKSARLVCNQWYLASLDPELTKRDQLVVQPQRDFPLNFFNGNNDCSKRGFFHLVVKDASSYKLESFWENEDFWLKVGYKLKSFSFEEACLDWSTTLSKALQYCPNLQTLYFKCDERIPSYRLNDMLWNNVCKARTFAIPKNFPTLLKLKEFTLFGHCSSDKNLFYEILIKAPNLKTILLKTYNESPYKEADFTPAHVTACLKKYPHRLFELSLVVDRNETGSDHESLAELLALRNVQLQSLEITFFPFAIRETCYAWLKEFLCIADISDTDFSSICTNLPNLEKLTLSSLDGVLSTGIEALASLKKLAFLSLETCKTVRDESLLIGFCSEVNPTLKEICLHGILGRATHKFFVEFARTHPALTSLTLTDCPGLDDWSVQAFFKYQTSLKVLALPYSAITDVGLDGSRLYGPLNKGQSENPTGHSISRLKGLQELNLKGCLSVRGSIFEGEIRFPNLKTIGLAKTQDFKEVTNYSEILICCRNSELLHVFEEVVDYCACDRY